jgi:hypothetical protein
VRRVAQLGALRPDLVAVEVRGNVPTRLEKLRAGDAYDGLMLAAAGLDRLGLDLGDLRRIDLDPALLLPAPAQGALALEIRRGDPLGDLLTDVHDVRGYPLVAAERGLMAMLDAGCQLALGAHAIRAADGQVALDAWFEGVRGRRPARLRRGRGLPRLRGARPTAAGGVRGGVRVAVTASLGRLETLEARLAAAGFEAVRAPLLTIRPLPDGQAEARALLGLPLAALPQPQRGRGLDGPRPRPRRRRPAWARSARVRRPSSSRAGASAEAVGRPATAAGLARVVLAHAAGPATRRHASAWCRAIGRDPRWSRRLRAAGV